MRASVRAAFVAFTEKFEGYVPWMYPDVKGLVTIGIGNLIDPIAAALTLPFVRADGSPASKGEISDEWMHVKALGATPEGKLRGAAASKAICKLHLTQDGVAQVVGLREDLDDAYLAHRWPEYETWPAAAQLGALSRAWAAGPGVIAPKFDAAAARQDWLTCAAECGLDEHADNPGIRARNAATKQLFLAAAANPSDDLDAPAYAALNVAPIVDVSGDATGDDELPPTA